MEKTIEIHGFSEEVTYKLWILIYWRVMGEHDGKQVGYISFGLDNLIKLYNHENWWVSYFSDNYVHVGMGQNLLYHILGEWTSIYHLFQCSSGHLGFDF